MVRYARARVEAPMPADLRAGGAWTSGPTRLLGLRDGRRGGEVDRDRHPRRHALGLAGERSEAHREAIEQRKGRGDGSSSPAGPWAPGGALDCSIYDLDPAAHGHFDFVYLGSLLLHLRDPVLALERVRAITRGQLLIVDAIALGLTRSARVRHGWPSTGTAGRIGASRIDSRSCAWRKRRDGGAFIRRA